MAVSDVIARFRGKAVDAKADFDALAVAVVEGKTVKDSTIEKACIASGRSMTDFTTRLEVLAKRKEAWDRWGERDFNAELTALMDRRRELFAEKKSASDEAKAMQAEYLRVSREADQCVDDYSRVQRERRAISDEVCKLLRSTGGDDDWRDVGPPTTPKRREKVEVSGQAPLYREKPVDVGYNGPVGRL